MKITRSLTLIFTGLLLLPSGRGLAQTEEDAIAEARVLIKADREVVVDKGLQLTESESQAFWPLYDRYRAEMDSVTDGAVKLVKEYAECYPDVPDDRARAMLKDLTKLEKKKVATRVTYLKRFGKILPPTKNLRFAQIENRLDLAVQLKVASEIPLVPIEGVLRGTRTGTSTLAKGVPGGVAVQVYELEATVTAINKAARWLTLMSRDGIKQTVQVGPEVVNFDQVRVGDKLRVQATQELVVHMADSNGPASDEGATLVALAPKGAKPGGVMAQTMQVTATITAIDDQQRTATLRFDDGSTRTFPVRSDVDLSKRKVGEKVVFTITEAVALGLTKE